MLATPGLRSTGGRRYMWSYLSGLIIGVVVPVLLDPSRTKLTLPAVYTYSTSNIVVQVASPHAANITAAGNAQAEAIHNTSVKRHTEDELFAGDEQLMDDTHKHKDDTKLADSLYDKVKVLCWVVTYSRTVESRIPPLYNTWGKKCHKFLYASDNLETHNASLSMNISVKAGRFHLTQKVMTAFDYVYEHHPGYDWYLRADQDTYIVMENLRYFLSEENPAKKSCFGHALKKEANSTWQYAHGGAGFVLSRAALEALAARKEGDCAADGVDADEDIGKCMTKMGVDFGDTRDSLLRARFNPVKPKSMLSGNVPEWYQFSVYPNGNDRSEKLSDYPISFHTLTSKEMISFEYFMYHLQPYGVLNYAQKLNRPVKIHFPMNN